jgi:hypothetical protein
VAVATGCHSQSGFIFQPKLTLDFDGGTITTDPGLVLLREFDERLGLTRPLGTLFPDPRDRRYVDHDLLTLLRQRVYQIAAGYEDANDATRLRHDPTLQVVAGRIGQPLASQPTLSRLENAVGWDAVDRCRQLGLEWFCQHGLPRRGPAPRELILDVDSTDDPTHGQQILSFFNGHYDEHMYHPLLVFEGTSGFLLGTRLRPGNEGGATRLLPLLRPIVRRLRRRCPTTLLALRADGGFCNPAVLTYAEDAGLHYAIGMPRNSKLEALVAPLRAEVEARWQATGQPLRCFTSFRYQAGSWPRPRRVVAKVEVTAGEGLNVRFVVTNRHGSATEIFAWYNARGQAENYIKDLKLGVAADRLSCHAYRANAWRLQLHALAYNLLALFRQRVLAGTALATTTFTTLRVRLFKVGARVLRSARRLWFHLATGWPGQTLFLDILRRLRTVRASP